VKAMNSKIKRFVIKFLLHGKTKTITLDSKSLTSFYQNKLEAINVISVKGAHDNKPISDITQFVKPKKSIWCL